MAQSIKLDNDKFVDATGVYDSTLGKTQGALNSRESFTLELFNADAGSDLNVEYAYRQNNRIYACGTFKAGANAGWGYSIFKNINIPCFGLVVPYGGGNAYRLKYNGTACSLEAGNYALTSGNVYEFVIS